ncbi:serine hydrolase domain-containing protein [Parvularcula maris]|nr:serine hydrolase domain-containing protein [Parvularcula maris]
MPPLWSLAARTGLLAFATLATCAAAPPQEEYDRQELRETIEARLAANGVPGAYVAVVQNGRTSFEVSYGTETIDGGKAFDKNSSARLASATKVLSGLTFLSMVEEGELNLEATLGELDPSVPDRFKPLPVWRILNHTSGLPMIVTEAEFQDLDVEGMLAFEPEDILRLIGDRSLDFEPGEGWHYQQSGYGLLAGALQKATGKTFLELMEEHVLTPAGMSSTVFNEPDTIARAYSGENGALRPHPGIFVRPLLPAGGMDTTGADLIALVQALGRGMIVKKDTISRELLQPQRLQRLGRDAEGEGYGLATIISRNGDVWTMGHSGGGGLANIRYSPGEDTAIIVLTNRSGGTNSGWEIAELLSTELFGEPHVAVDE